MAKVKLTADEQAHIDDVLREMHAKLDKLERVRASPEMKRDGYVRLTLEEARELGLVPVRSWMH